MTHKIDGLQPSILNARVGERMLLEARLRRALEQEQFVLHYQPQFNSQTKRLSGLEALVRWQDPTAGLVSPEHFIAIMEE